MKIVIKNPAPENESSHRWGDYHFGCALRNALEVKGVQVMQHFSGDWGKLENEDVVLVLRGLTPYEPSRGKKAILWIISHPADITAPEIRNYDLIYCASETLVNLVQALTDRPVILLRQCTDISKFYYDFRSAAGPDEPRKNTIFVANARGIRRDIAWWASKCVNDLEIYGGGWDYFGLSEHVVKGCVTNDDLPTLYRAARVGLNDHWADMRQFGLINNRIFDCLACGLPVISDSFPELREVFGDAVLYADSEDEFRSAVTFLEGNYSLVVSRVESFWSREKENYSFDSRALRIVEDAGRLLAGDSSSLLRNSKRAQSRFLSMLWMSMVESARHHRSQLRAREQLLASMRLQFERKSERQRSELERQRSELERQRKAVEETGKYSLALERELDRLRGSVSWKSTAALRWLKSVYKRARRRSSSNDSSIRRRRPLIVEQIERRRSCETASKRER